MNRRQRRAQETPKTKPQSADDILLSQPDRSGKSTKTKTLYEIAAKKQAELLPQAKAFDGKNASASNVVNIKIGSDGKIIKEGEHTGTDPNTAGADSNVEPIPPFFDTLFLTASLSMIHFTLETLTVHQYAQELRFPPIFKHTFLVAFPTLFFLIHLFHGHLLSLSSGRFSPRVKNVIHMLMQIVYVVIANVSGCYLIQLTNDRGYYAVMKNAPSVGTVWVWSVIELGLAGALAGVIGPGIYAWYNGYGVI